MRTGTEERKNPGGRGKMELPSAKATLIATEGGHATKPLRKDMSNVSGRTKPSHTTSGTRERSCFSQQAQILILQRESFAEITMKRVGPYSI